MLLMKPTTHYGIQKSSSVVSVMNQINRVQHDIPVLLNIYLNISSHLRLFTPSGFFPLDLPIKIMYALLISSMGSKYHAQLTVPITTARHKL